MSESFASLAGVRIVAGMISIPLTGAMVGDVSLATDQALPERFAVVVGNLTMQAAAYRQGLFAGTRTVRFVGGAGGWRRNVPFYQYSRSAGVQLSTVLGDAARAVGERVSINGSVNLGRYWVREAAPAARLLHVVAGDRWFVDPQGVTQVLRDRSDAMVTSPFQVIGQACGQGRVEVTAEDYASWLPGRRFKTPLLAVPFRNCGVYFRFDSAGKMRLEVMTA